MAKANVKLITASPRRVIIAAGRPTSEKTKRAKAKEIFL